MWVFQGELHGMEFWFAIGTLIIIFFHFKDFIFHLCVCVSALRYQKRVLDPLQLKLQMVVSLSLWVLGTEVWVLWKNIKYV